MTVNTKKGGIKKTKQKTNKTKQNNLPTSQPANQPTNSVRERYLALSLYHRTTNHSITCIGSMRIDHCWYSTPYAMTQPLNVEPTPVPDVKQLPVRLQFKLMDSFVESYVQECSTCVSKAEIRTASWSWLSRYGFLLKKLHYSPCSLRSNVVIWETGRLLKGWKSK